jgi:hypothetical protein
VEDLDWNANRSCQSVVFGTCHLDDLIESTMYSIASCSKGGLGEKINTCWVEARRTSSRTRGGLEHGSLFGAARHHATRADEVLEMWAGTEVARYVKKADMASDTERCAVI